MRIYLVPILTLLLLLACSQEKQRDRLIVPYRSYVEGPHILHEGEYDDILYFSRKDGRVELVRRRMLRADTTVIEVDNPVFDPFAVEIRKDETTPRWTFPTVDRVVVISDIEGNFAALYSILLAQGVIDTAGNWVYGDGHLVMLGDLFDRGPDVTPLLWWLYVLEEQAQGAGGHLHILLGNHELMIIGGDTRYIHEKYRHQQKVTGIDYTSLYSTESVLGNWLRSKPALTRIGYNLFSHGGISPQVLGLDMSIDDLNRRVISRNLQLEESESIADDVIFGSNGIFWYRGWVESPPTEEVLNLVLEKYKAERMVIGHTVVPSIQTSFDGKLVMADVEQPGNVNGSVVKALLIEDGKFFEINNKGERKTVNAN